MPSPRGGGGVVSVGVPALLPCNLLLMVLASAIVCSVASVTEMKLKTFVAKDLRGSNANWRSPVTVSNVFFAVVTLVSSVCAEVYNVLSDANCNAVFDGL